MPMWTVCFQGCVLSLWSAGRPGRLDLQALGLLSCLAGSPPRNRRDRLRLLCKERSQLPLFPEALARTFLSSFHSDTCPRKRSSQMNPGLLACTAGPGTATSGSQALPDSCTRTMATGSFLFQKGSQSADYWITVGPLPGGRPGWQGAGRQGSRARWLAGSPECIFLSPNCSCPPACGGGARWGQRHDWAHLKGCLESLQYSVMVCNRSHPLLHLYNLGDHTAFPLIVLEPFMVSPCYLGVEGIPGY